MGGSVVPGMLGAFLFLRRHVMEQELNKHREDLIIANEKIELAAKILTVFRSETKKIYSILGTYHEMAKIPSQ